MESTGPKHPAKTTETSLVALLQLAYSGERAAAYAYRGHWHSVSDPAEKDRIKQIEAEEWDHRRLVGEMLQSFGAGPNKWRELRATLIGRVLGIGCHMIGWFAPMYGAGKLESRNIVEYETAAKFARDCGRDDLIECLLEMAEVEWEHEHYFRRRVENHKWLKYFALWPAPPPKESIRTSFITSANSASLR
jgi:rubrerythrin